MNDNMEKARAAQKRAGPAPRELLLSENIKIVTNTETVNIMDAVDNTTVYVRMSLEKSMALRNLLSTWGNEKRNRDKRKEKL